jgi:class 3 adenylate cyclase/tetratricopeptide (TPR) repeat protein/ribosomal protein L40E
MECPKCQTENPEENSFCRQCGAKLLLVCPKCGAEVLPGDKFCGKCGHKLSLPSEPPLKELSFEEKIDKIQRYLPKGLTEKILSQRDKIEGEHKQVTVMFCDMEGFTNLSERLGPEEAYDIVDQIYELLIHKVHGYEGTVNEMTGDGIVALFGAPIALEDAPQRAIRSAMAIHREMSGFSDRLREEREYLPTLKMRVGIHTGPVVVGTVGNNLRVEFKAVGDTVNLASRMEGLAEPGATYVTEETFKLTEGFFRFEALGEKEVKGKKEPIKVYRAIAPSTRRTRFDVSAERGLTPFVGRDREIELLLDAFERAKAGRGQAISIMSEAGVGKSRLLYEFRKRVSNEDVTFLEGKCLSYSRGVAYHPVIEILKSNFDVREEDTDSEISEKIKKGLKVLGADEATTLPYLLELLSVRDSGIDKIMMSPEGKRDQIIEALKRIVLKGSEIRPLVMAIEDLHWMDKSSGDVLKYLLESIPGAPVFLIFTYRPEFVHTWGAKSFHNQLTLNRLSNRESLSMVTHLLATEEVDSDLEELILNKTEGVPFFIEEFIRSFKDLKVIEKKDSKYELAKDIQGVSIPTTIQEVIMTRVDSLPESAKEVLQAGSVIEREFSYELIIKIMNLPEKELLSHLSVLKDLELLYERGIYPESTYVFKHALTQEVVYDSILTRRKKQFHTEIGNTIEILYEKSIEENYGILVEHFIAGGDYEKAAKYSKLAGKKGEKKGSLSEGIAYAKKSIFCLEKLPQTKDVQKKLIDIRTILSLYYLQMNYNVEAKETVDPIIDLVIKHNYQKRLSQIYTILGTYSCITEEDIPKALEYFDEALKFSEEAGDILSSFMAKYWLGLALCYDCQFERGLPYLEEALRINLATNTLWGISALKSIISHHIYLPTGRVELSYQVTEEAIRIAEESGDIYSRSVAYTCHGASCYVKGLLEEATKNLLYGHAFCERINYFSWEAVAQFFLAEAYFDIRDYQESKESYEKALRAIESIRMFPSWAYQIKIRLATARVMNNEKDIDLESFYGYANRKKLNWFDPWTLRNIGEILLNIDDKHLDEAEIWIRKAVEAAERNGMRWHLANDYTLYADLFKRKGDKSKAKENLTRAIDTFKKCGAEGWVKKYEEELDSLS